MTPRTITFPSILATLLVGSVGFADTPSAKASKLLLELAGTRVEADEATVVSEKHGEQDPLIAKPPAGKQEEIALRGGAAMARDIAKLVDDAFTKECVRRVDGNLIFADKDYGELSRLSFAWGAVTDVGLTALDTTSKDVASITLKLQPQFPRRAVQHGEKAAHPPSGPAWLRSTFKLSIDGLDAPLKSVRQVGELHVSQTPSAGTPVSCAAPAVTDLTFAIPTADAAGLTAWKDTRGGSIDYLAADGSSVVRVRLSGLRKKAQTAEGTLTRVTASIEAVAFDPAKKRERAPLRAASRPIDRDHQHLDLRVRLVRSRARGGIDELADRG
ncbi:MAG: hypothetical protein K0S65_4014, partial [Labilithrix sp.]|nr:hypothetical protein [Labilithrix sp.]